MIALVAEIEIKATNPNPFLIGSSKVGNAALGTTIKSTQEIEKSNILSSESEIRDRAEFDKPSFGLISCGGSISFRDENKRFLNYAELGILVGGEKVSIYLENTVLKSREKIGQYYATSWSYDNDNSTVSVYFQDKLEELQDQDFFEIEIKRDKGITDFYDYIYSKLKLFTEARGFSFEENSFYKLISVLSRFYSSTFYINEASIWAEYQKVCDLVGANVFCGKNGDVFTNLSLNWS